MGFGIQTIIQIRSKLYLQLFRYQWIIQIPKPIFQRCLLFDTYGNNMTVFL